MPDNKPKIKYFAKTAFLLLFLIFFVLAGNGCLPKTGQQEYISIGALFPLTGEFAEEGIRAVNGLLIANAEINAEGGILGKQLDIFILNDKGDEDYVFQQYEVLKEKGVVAVIGSSYSNVAIALAIASEKDGIPIISPTASNPYLTKGRNNVFRSIFTDEEQSEVMAKFAYNSLNAKTAVILYNKNNTAFKQLAETFINSFTANGGQIIAEPYSTVNDFADILNKYASVPPDIFYCPENFIPAAKLVNAAHEAGLNDTPILGSDAWDGFLSYVNQPDVMSEVYYTSPFSFNDNDPAVERFVRKYFASFAKMPLAGSATAYTCVYILVEAIKKAESTNMEDIISAISENELDSIIGRIKYDENNNPNTNMYIFRIKGGIYSTCEKLNTQRRE